MEQTLNNKAKKIKINKIQFVNKIFLPTIME